MKKYLSSRVYYTLAKNTQMKQMILKTIEDSVTNLLYYGRKEDEELPIGAIERLIEDGDITIDEMVAEFKKSLEFQLAN